MYSRNLVKILINNRTLSTKPSYVNQLGKTPLKLMTIGQLVEKASEKFNTRKAIISREQNVSLTFSEALKAADKLAAGLKKIGLEKNDLIGIWAPNIIEWYISNLACARGNFLMVALNPAYKPSEIEYCINKIQIKAIICGEHYKNEFYYEKLVNLAPELRSTTPGELNCSRIPSLSTVISTSTENLQGTYNFEEITNLANKSEIDDVRSIQNDIQADDPCHVLFTSGTTGKSKAAQSSHFFQINSSFLIGKYNELDGKHHTICMQVPFFHIYGTTVGILSALHFGSTLVLPSIVYNADRNLNAIKEEKCTVIYGTPTMYIDLIQKQEERNDAIEPEIAVSGGAICAPSLFQKIFKTLKIQKVKSIYGLTEAAGAVFHSLPNESQEKTLSTVGRLYEHLEAKVVDTTNRIVPFGTPGELCIRGYCNMLKYINDEEKTKEVMAEDRWLRTGDQFILHEDGYGEIVGRFKDMIIRGGENIYPKEIEDVLSRHPKISEIAVIGVPDERLGETVCACVKLTSETTITLAEIKEHCRETLAHFKIPTMLEIVDDFPKTTSGKIQKFLLQQMFNRNPQSELKEKCKYFISSNNKSSKD